MESKSVFLRNFLTALILMFAFVSFSEEVEAAPKERKFVKGDYNAVIYVYLYEEGQDLLGTIAGGSKDGKWYNHTALPITINGKTRDLMGEIPENEAYESPIPCLTPFLKQGDSVVFYSLSGEKFPPALAGKISYSASAASGESFLDVSFEISQPPFEELLVGINGEWNALITPTKRESTKETFSFTSLLKEAGEAVTATFTATKRKNGELFYKSALKIGDKEWPLTNIEAEDPKDVSGFFIDLNGDGKNELILYVTGVWGTFSVYEIGDAEPDRIMGLDFGD